MAESPLTATTSQPPNTCPHGLTTRLASINVNHLWCAPKNMSLLDFQAPLLSFRLTGLTVFHTVHIQSRGLHALRRDHPGIQH